MEDTLEDTLENLQIKFEKEITFAPIEQLIAMGQELGMDELDASMKKTKIMMKLRNYIMESQRDEVEEQVNYMKHVHNTISKTMKQDEVAEGDPETITSVQVAPGSNTRNFSGGTSDQGQRHQEYPQQRAHDGYPRREMPIPTHHADGNDGDTGTQQVLGLIRALADTNISQRRQLKIVGVIGDSKDAKTINYINLQSQVTDAQASGFKDEEIARSIKKSVAANSHLRTYFDSVATMPLKKMLSILRDFYQEKSASELFAELGQLCQNPTEKSTDFLLRAMQTRQRTTSAANAEGNLYDYKLVQGTFIRTLKTGFREESIRAQLTPFLDQKKPSDDSVLLREASLADLEFEEKLKKQKRDKKVTIAQANVNSPDLEAALKPIVETMSCLQRQMGEMQQQTKSREDRRQTTSQNMYNQRGASANTDIRDRQTSDSRDRSNNYSFTNQGNFRYRNQSPDNNYGSRNQPSDNRARSRNNSTNDRGQARANNYSRYSSKPDYRCDQCRMDDTPRCSHCWKCGSIQHRAAECTTSKN